MTIAPQMTGIGTCVIATVEAPAVAVLGAAIQADWKKATCLKGAAVLKSVGNDCVVELAWWDSTAEVITSRNRALKGELLTAAPAGTIEVHTLSMASITAGPAHRGPSAALHLESGSTQPVLVGVFDPIHRGRPALLHYLEDAGNRFVNELAGWVGAALFCDVDRKRLVECLQFDSMEAAGLSQASPIIHAHQRELLTFGNLAANLYWVDAAIGF